MAGKQVKYEGECGRKTGEIWSSETGKQVKYEGECGR